jgi:hypothetical protein
VTRCEFIRCTAPATTTVTFAIPSEQFPSATTTSALCAEHAWAAESDANFLRYAELTAHPAGGTWSSLAEYYAASDAMAQERSFYHEHGQPHASDIYCQPCPGGPHTYDADGNSICHIPTADQPCGSFVSAGYGPEGDYEHSVFCSSCGWESADHIEPCPTCGMADGLLCECSL